MENLVVFILVHGRPDKMWTYSALRKCGYTGEVFFVADNLDPTLQGYKDRYGDKLLIFDKKEVAKNMDAGDNTGDLRSSMFASNAVFKLAEEKGIRYFFIMMDDYQCFYHNYNKNLEFKGKRVKNLDAVFDAMLKFYIDSNALMAAFAQTGDFIGGKDSTRAKEIMPMRKAMNTYLCSTDRPFQFIGRMNEDVTTYVALGWKGELFLTVPNISISQLPTQKASGGMTEVYKDYGTYIKSFFSVMYNPSCVTVYHIGTTNRRIHHKVNWRYAVPKILDESIKK